MSAPVQQIKDRLGIVEVISGYLKLEKAGINYKARCPFHQEKTASFFVSPARNSFYCFGCNKGGDVFSFVEEIEGLDFVGALKVLAERAGVPLERSNFSQDPTRQSLFAILDTAKEFYRTTLADTPAAREYLARRGLTTETMEAWGLGFAPAEWRAVHEQLRRAGFTDEVIEKSGLTIVARANPGQPGTTGRYYDRFRSRIMFPLADSSGRVVGFSGRVFPPDAPPEAGGKYVNSPQTPLYDKSRLLYGFDRAKVAIRREDRAVLVEGQLDLLLSHQAGVTNAVAVSGTALTAHHLEALGRLTRNLVMAFDGDAAGIAAAARGIGLALEAGLEVRIARLPAGQDPADLIVADPTEWPRRVAGALHVIDFLLESVSERVRGERELAHALKREVYPYVARLRERIDQAHFIGKIAALTHLREEVIRADVAELAVRGNEGGSATLASKSPAVAAKSRLERIAERLAGLELLAGDPAHDAEIAELRREQELERVREERLGLMKELAQAQARGDEATMKNLLERVQAISQKINTIKNN